MHVRYRLPSPRCTGIVTSVWEVFTVPRGAGQHLGKCLDNVFSIDKHNMGNSLRVICLGKLCLSIFVISFQHFNN